ncbi:preprotein translocase subunit YajC [Chishuiella sp.]|uniref:preprotein translocase subunit YajC n=1 Tax=Chishuiella sp. TaxID=1969467 RepID=UPI0028B133F9|nr:preprotein translocase subunit YajC [Chishuiella sp.]
MIQTIFLQAGAQGGMPMLLMFGGIFVIMYFFMIRPQQKKAKQEKQFQDEIKRGDFVVTTSGIHGKINEIYDDAILIETGAGKIKFEKAAISKELTAARYGKATDKASKSEKVIEEDKK